MKHTEDTFGGVGGLELYYQRWQPEDQPRAILAIVHGFGEHSGRYMNVVNHFISHGYAIYGLDHRGHGRSPGQRGHINSWAEYREDVKAFLQRIREQEPEHSTFLLGHSMGALIALDYLLHYPEGLLGAIISGAPFEPAGVVKPSLLALALLLSPLWPGFSRPLALDKSALSRDPNVIQAYEADPLVHGRATARWGTEARSTLAWVKEHATDVSIPILLIHGEADRLNLAQGCRRFFETITFLDKTMRIYPQTYHEPHNDINHEQVMNDMEQWLEQHL